mgnify:CR=1 FL=1
MKELFERLRAIRGVEWLIGLGALSLLLLSMMGGVRQDVSQDGLEARLASVLSKVQGAGSVDVIVYTAGEEAQAVAAFGGVQTAVQRPSGVVVVADGAGDLQVRLELARAVQTLLSLPSSAVEVLQRDVNQ